MRQQMLGFTTLSLVLGIAPMAQAISYTFTTIEAPNASGTEAHGINNSGDIVGGYDDTTGTHGFLLRDGVLSTINFPGANFTLAWGINDSGDIVGGFSVASTPQGFLRSADGSIGSIMIGETFTQVRGINNQNEMVGRFTDSEGLGHGFVQGQDGTPTTIPNMSAHGINDHGDVVGGTPDQTQSLIRLAGGEPTSLIIGTTSQAMGINNHGDIAGFYSDSTGTGYSGFVIDGDSSTVNWGITVPGAYSTMIYGINDAGDIVGTFLGSDHRVYGFLGSSIKSVPEPSSLLLFGAGLIGLTIWGRKQRRVS
ncbi:MAG: PEP-CTERM sorting domain-containing protein [Nitrospiria bacterium]